MAWSKHLFAYLIFLSFLVAIEAFLQNTTSFDYDSRADTAGTSNRCVDNPKTKYVAPAKDCFDYLKMAIVWTPGYAFKQELNGQTIRKNLRAEWTIHGLWPSWYTGETSPGCYRMDRYLAEYHLKDAKVLLPLQGQDNNLHTALSNSWFSVHQQPPFNLWDHEFKKHGNCATRAKKIKDDVGYFQYAHNLYTKLNIGATLSSAKFKPGDSLKLSDLLRILRTKVKAIVEVDYITEPNEMDDGNMKTYLTEVFVCYDAELNNAIDCPTSRHEKQDLVISYPTSVPKI